MSPLASRLGSTILVLLLVGPAQAQDANQKDPTYLIAVHGKLAGSVRALRRHRQADSLNVTQLSLDVEGEAARAKILAKVRQLKPRYLLLVGEKGEFGKVGENVCVAIAAQVLDGRCERI